ncbi:DUF4314 domain-containing protein [Actinomyces faecalis]|uniref:DUF4314 domain-containing protein n=1 Tax=Actinomyces faecalis TaxID=2722820 RepID=UPI002E2AFAC5|nr:DUF4314 domain-containing protein [Actinomyces faecalis]
MQEGLGVRPGCRIRLLGDSDTEAGLRAGMEGEVIVVDSLGTIHVAWDNGSSLGAHPRSGPLHGAGLTRAEISISIFPGIPGKTTGYTGGGMAVCTCKKTPAAPGRKPRNEHRDSCRDDPPGHREGPEEGHPLPGQHDAGR